MDKVHQFAVMIDHENNKGTVRFYRWGCKHKNKNGGLSYREYTFTKESAINVLLARCLNNLLRDSKIKHQHQHPYNDFYYYHVREEK